MIFEIFLFFLLAIFAFWISAICGGGASLILVPFLNLILPTSIVPFSFTIGSFTSSASRIIVFKKNIQWKIFIWFVPFSIPAVLAGAWLIKLLNPFYLQFVVGLFLLTNFPDLIKNRKKIRSVEKPYPKFLLAVVGFFAGFVSGVTGAIGLLFNRFYLRYGLTKEEIIATRAANEIFLHTIKLAVYIVLGLYSMNAIYLGIVIAFASTISSFSVKHILPFLSEIVFRRIGYGSMVLSGIFLLFTTTNSILQQDNISFSKNQYDEKTLNWRKSSFVLEYALDEGLEIEREIGFHELPENLKQKYNSLKSNYDEILLEKVFKINSKSTYEFYCFKENKLTKFEFEE
ncbi:sulfite exporter TauE/SafE family protein [Leptospira idonii]|uniref:Probable membrane transporter protein n=1 Tax=Leptospira idonii TaxID=1193500 RepID=A0A4V3JY16_9LEPT|nr:sulfite exporter TauE/SafE family protein [Leptospira idonii]TGN19536.1 sulfite exporter TauE/SafE family protein [Leptospira idonii]